MHTLPDLPGAIRSFIRVSDCRLHDVNVLDLLLAAPGTSQVIDRDYLDFAPLYRPDQAGHFFVTRIKRNLDASQLYSAPVDRNSGLICA